MITEKQKVQLKNVMKDWKYIYDYKQTFTNE